MNVPSCAASPLPGEQLQAFRDAFTHADELSQRESITDLLVRAGKMRSVEPLLEATGTVLAQTSNAASGLGLPADQWDLLGDCIEALAVVACRPNELLAPGRPSSLSTPSDREWLAAILFNTHLYSNKECEIGRLMVEGLLRIDGNYERAIAGGTWAPDDMLPTLLESQRVCSFLGILHPKSALKARVEQVRPAVGTIAGQLLPYRVELEGALRDFFLGKTGLKTLPGLLTGSSVGSIYFGEELGGRLPPESDVLDVVSALSAACRGASFASEAGRGLELLERGVERRDLIGIGCGVAAFVSATLTGECTSVLHRLNEGVRSLSAPNFWSNLNLQPSR
jgi:hypothetical protein